MTALDSTFAMTRHPFAIFTIFFALSVSLVFVAAALFGDGSIGCFSPDTLQSRRQTEYVIPMTDVQVYRSAGSVSRWPIVNYLIAKGYWSDSKVSEPRWICTSRENPQWRCGTSRFERELAGNEAEWRKWTEENPELANCFWPRLLAELRKPGTSHISEVDMLLGVARIAKSPEEFDRLTRE